jgi:ankyrin repeat protein
VEWAWDKILSGNYEENTQREMEELFSDRDVLQESGFGTLHRIVLGLDSNSLEDYLTADSASANSVDHGGKTALSWAARRGMASTVKILLRHGADPNIHAKGRNSALHYAAMARTPECIQLLIDFGAEVDYCDGEGQTALHHAAINRADLAYYRPLIEAGANPNHPTIRGTTPLATAISEGHTEAAQYLIEQGADIDLKCQLGRPPVFYAVEYNNHAGLEALIEKGAKVNVASEKYPTIAHIAAWFADAETLRILTRFRLEIDDVECVAPDGLSVPQIIEARIHADPRHDDTFIRAFSNFLGSISITRPHGVEFDDAEYHDALESPNS